MVLVHMACDAPAYSAGAVVRVRIKLSAAASVRLDWVAIQLCGFVTDLHPVSGPPPPTSAASGGGGTALLDESAMPAANQLCTLASSPLVIAAGTSIEPQQSRTFLVHCTLPAQLPPSFAGSEICSEYVFVLTVRTMAPPKSYSAQWSRGPIHRVQLPVPVICSAA